MVSLLSHLLTSLSTSKEGEYYVTAWMKQNKTVIWSGNDKQHSSMIRFLQTHMGSPGWFPNMTSTPPRTQIPQIWWNLNQGAAQVRGTQPARPAWTLQRQDAQCSPSQDLKTISTYFNPFTWEMAYTWPMNIWVYNEVELAWLIFSDICWHWLSSQYQLYQRRTPSPLKL